MSQPTPRSSRASGADLDIVQEQLGHASIQTTTIYARATKEDKARAADALAKAYRYSQQVPPPGGRWPRRRPPTLDTLGKGAAGS